MSGNPDLKVVKGKRAAPVPKLQMSDEEKAAVSRDYLPDDDMLTQWLTATWEGKFTYFLDNWYSYEKGYWRLMHDVELQQAVREFLRKKRQEFRRLKLDMKLIRSISQMSRMDCYLPTQAITSGDEYLNLRNGMLNLTTLELEPHRHDAYFTWQLDFEYEPMADAPTFRKYLNASMTLDNGEVDYRMIDLIQEAFGYSLTADTSHKSSFWVLGPKDSGKSTLIALLREMLGTMHQTINLNDIEQNQYLVAELIGKRAATCTEANANSYLPDGIFKILVGGEDEVQANRKHKDPISFKPKCKIWWGMNEPPRVRDRSGAVYRRIQFIVFPRSISEDKQIGGLIEKLKDERAGILNWSLEGLQRLRRAKRFTKPDRSVAKMEEYKLMNDPTAMFLQECATLDSNLMTPADMLQKAMSSWRKDNGYPPKSRQRTKEDLARFNVFWKRSNTGNVYEGIALNEEGQSYLQI